MADQIRALSPAEAESKYAGFYEKQECAAAEAVVAAYAQPMDPAEAILPENINDIFKVTGEKNGYCMIPCDGHKDGAYAVMTTRFEGATNDMICWWYAWRGLESVNYTVTNSTRNHSIAMNDQHKAKVRNPYMPDETKCRGIIQSCVKHTDACEMEDFIVHLQRPEEMEIKPENFADSNVAFVGGWYMREDRTCKNPYQKAIDEFALVCVQDEAGVTVYTHIWCGYRGLKGSNMRMDSYGPVIDEAYAKQIGLSFAQDMAQLASVLPELYAVEH